MHCSHCGRGGQPTLGTDTPFDGCDCLEPDDAQAIIRDKLREAFEDIAAIHTEISEWKPDLFKISHTLGSLYTSLKEAESCLGVSAHNDPVADDRAAFWSAKALRRQ